jgi:hypothetical protein
MNDDISITCHGVRIELWPLVTDSNLLQPKFNVTSLNRINTLIQHHGWSIIDAVHVCWLKLCICLLVIYILVQDETSNNRPVIDPDPEYQTLGLYHVRRWDLYILFN